MTKPYAYLTAGIAALLVAVLTLSPITLLANTSNTSIEAGQTFIFGGEQRMPITVAARNDGEVPVEILLFEKGSERSVATLAPGASMKVKMLAGNIALFRNASSKTAMMHFKFRGNINELTMGYRGNR
jgi:hypothetical protein